MAFASPSDHAVCSRLHRRHGTTYYLASRRFPRATRRHVDAVYGFVRVPDEWVDNPGSMTVAESAAKLEGYRHELLLGLRGVRPGEPALRAFVDTMRAVGMTEEEPLLFLDAMRMDLQVDRYANWHDLCGYMRGSASAVGLMMCQVVGAPSTRTVRFCAMRLGEAMQLTNFLRDVAEDARRGRVYLPEEDMEAHGVSRDDVLGGRWSTDFERLMRFEIARARRLYEEADPGIPELPSAMRPAVRIARVLYARILDRLEAQGANPFLGRARTSRWEKLCLAAAVGLRR